MPVILIVVFILIYVSRRKVYAAQKQQTRPGMSQ
jgi:hypothetical protein